MTSSRRRRVAGALSLGATVAVGLAVHGWGSNPVLGDIAGDALYTVAVYSLLVAVWPRLSPVSVGAIAAGGSVAVELFQATGVPATLAERVPPIALVLGRGFDARDLVVYVAAAVVAGVVDTAVRRRR